MRRHGFIAARRKNHTVPLNRARVHLHHIGDCFAGRENDIHSRSSLRAAVADVRAVILCRETAFFENAVLGLFGESVKMYASRVRIAIRVFYHNLRLLNVMLVPAAAHFESVKLRPP